MKILTIAKGVVSLAGVGFIRPASATWGSAAAGIILFFTFPTLTLAFKIGIIITTFVIGTLLGEYIEKQSHAHDPHFLVIDEAVGMMIVCLFLSAVWWQFALAFILFRIFDIAKLWPASIFDKRSGGFAAMVDDVIMAFPALAVLHLILLFI